MNATTDNDRDTQMEESNKDPDSLSTGRARLAHAILITVTLQKAREKGVIVRQYPLDRLQLQVPGKNQDFPN
jgi:hypothetical protein